MAAKPGIRETNKTVSVFLKILINAIMIIVTACSLFPLLWTLWSSFKTSVEFASNQVGLPHEFYLGNYKEAYRVANMNVTIPNTIFVTVGAVIIIIVFSFIIGYFCNRFTFMGKRFVYLLFLTGMLIPVHSFMVPVAIQASNMKMTDNLWILMMTDAAFGLSLPVVLIENFLNGVPREVEEAAVIDGTSLGQRIMLVVVPMTRPIISTVVILESLWMWNEFPFALTLINDTMRRTLPLAMSNFRGEHKVDYTSLFAGLILVSLPIFIVYSFFSNQIMEGMTAGAVKG